jgi:hypothetical protein
MVNGAFAFTTGSFDFRLEQREALIQFLDRERVEILPGELEDQIVLAAGKSLFDVHRATNVDPRGGDVNKSRGAYRPRKTP